MRLQLTQIFLYIYWSPSTASICLKISMWNDMRASWRNPGHVHLCIYLFIHSFKLAQPLKLLSFSAEITLNSNNRCNENNLFILALILWYVAVFFFFFFIYINTCYLGALCLRVGVTAGPGGAWVLVGVPPGAWVGACAWARLWCGGLRCIGASAGGRVQ